jgi:hypothetical protein
MDYVMMCHAHGCLLSLNCKRFTAKPSEQQAYFTDAPYRFINNETICEYYINNEDEERRIGENEPNGIEETKQDS